MRRGNGVGYLGNPHGYELCIDASVGEEAAADMICSYIRRKN